MALLSGSCRNCRRKPSLKSWGPHGGRVNFFMNKFRKLGFIDYNGGIKVKPALLSVVLHA
jgi:hypothetical protein